MTSVSSSAPGVTEPGQGDPRRFQIGSSEHRRVVSIKAAQTDPPSSHSDSCILRLAPLKWNVPNCSERGGAESSLSKLRSLGKRKEPSSPLDNLLGDSSESSRADSPLPPRKVARISHDINPTRLPYESPPETSSSSKYPCP